MTLTDTIQEAKAQMQGSLTETFTELERQAVAVDHAQASLRHAKWWGISYGMLGTACVLLLLNWCLAQSAIDTQAKRLAEAKESLREELQHDLNLRSEAHLDAHLRLMHSPVKRRRWGSQRATPVTPSPQVPE